MSQTDPGGGFEYTEYYNPKFPLLPTEEMDKAGGKWKWEYDEKGNTVKAVDALGAETEFRYHGGLVSQIINGLGSLVSLCSLS